LLSERTAFAEILRHRGEGHHADAGMRQHVIDQPLERHENMRLAGAVRMPISCPALMIISAAWGKLSMECPVTPHVVVIP
jgi:hypothetical protein